jgi:hypothetical protein
MINLLGRGQNFEHLLALLILLARGGDIGSTYLASPNLRLETNPFIRRFRWPIALLSLALCLLPYYNTALAVMVLAPSLLVSGSNLKRSCWPFSVRRLGASRRARRSPSPRAAVPSWRWQAAFCCCSPAASRNGPSGSRGV